MNRRTFTRTMLLGTGELTLLGSSHPLLAASLWSSHGGHAKAPSLSVHVGKPIEITHSRDRCWFPSLQQFANKDLIVTMSMHADTPNPEGGFHEAYCISQDGGETWGERQGASILPNAWCDVPDAAGGLWGLSTQGSSAVHGSDEDFHVTRTEISQPAAASPVAAIKLRGDVRLHMLVPTGSIMFTGTILAAQGDALVGLVYCRSKDAPRYYRLCCIRSEDQGNSWREVSVIASVGKGVDPSPGMGSDGPCESGLVRLRDGRLFVMFRTGSDGWMGVAWSSDEGENWTLPVLIPYKGVEPRVRLLSNGVLACSTGRPGPVTMMFSLDGTGKSWSHETTLFTDMSTRYTEFVELAPGKLFLVYDSVPYGWQEIPESDRKAQNALYGKYITVELRS